MKKGFTLIELLVVILIVTSVTGISIMGIGTYTSSKELTVESQRLATTLISANKKASAGNLSSKCSNEFFGYRVVLNEDSYETKLLCSTDGTLDVSQQFYKFRPLLFATINPDLCPTNPNLCLPVNIDFQPLNRGATEKCININYNNGEKCRYIKVEASGVVSEGACTTCPCSCP